MTLRQVRKLAQADPNWQYRHLAHKMTAKPFTGPLNHRQRIAAGWMREAMIEKAKPHAQ